MARKKPRTIESLTERPKPVEKRPIKVRCIKPDCWTAGGFLSVGDETMVAYDRAHQLRDQGKVEFV